MIYVYYTRLIVPYTYIKDRYGSSQAYVDYVTYTPKIENNTIKIGYFTHKYKFSTFIIVDGYRHRINRNSIKVIISLDLSASSTNFVKTNK